jgi:hypothetical protein
VLKVRRRIELLEEALLPAEQGSLHFIHIDFVAPDGTVAETRVLEVPIPAPAQRNRGWRTARGSWHPRRQA